MLNQKIRFSLAIPLLFVLLLSACGRSPESTDTVMLDVNESASDDLFERYYELNDYVTQGELTLAVIGWGLSYGNELTQPEDGKVFLIVDIIMVNQSDEMLSFIDTVNMIVRDAQGVETMNSGRFYFPGVAEFPYFFGLAPGEGIRHLLVYEVRDQDEEYRLTFEPVRIDIVPDGVIFEIPLAKKRVARQLPNDLLAPVPGSHALGETFSAGGASLTVLGWELIPIPETSMLYLGVDLVVENQGNDPITLLEGGNSFLLRDRSGFRYDRVYGTVASDELGYAAVEIGDLLPGDCVSGGVVFRVLDRPEDYVFSFDLIDWGEVAERTFIELGSHPEHVTAPAGVCGG